LELAVEQCPLSSGAEIWSSRLRSGTALELAVDAERARGGQASSDKTWRPSPGRWGKQFPPVKYAGYQYHPAY